MPSNLDLVRYVVAGAIALVLVVLLAVIGLAIWRGIDISSSQLLGLLAFVGTLVGLLANLVGTRQMAVSVKNVSATLSDVKEKVNGHLEKHIGHTDDQVAALVDQRLVDHGIEPGSATGGT